MLLLDTSVWVEVLRGHVGRARDLIAERPDEIAVTDLVVGEVLAGARDPDRVDSRLSALPLRSLDPALDFRAGAHLFRAARRAGLTVRSYPDCVVASVALRHGDTLVHRDADFEALGRCSALETLDLR